MEQGALDYLIKETIDILTLIKDKITDDSDMVWTRFNTASELRTLLNDYIIRIKENDTNAFREINTEFGPTSSLQEHSLSNGWGHEFLTLAKKYDDIYLAIWK